jgi:hypothetical protein
MKILLLLLTSCSLLVSPQASAVDIWMSAKSLLEGSDLIAVVDVSTVHEVTTPEGFRLQSADAKIVREIYRRFPAIPEAEKSSIIIYSLDPNALITEKNFGVDGSSIPICEGKAFVCLREKGVNKFYPFPYAYLSFQSMKQTELIKWPADPTIRQGLMSYSSVPLSTVIKLIDELHKNK